MQSTAVWFNLIMQFNQPFVGRISGWFFLFRSSYLLKLFFKTNKFLTFKWSISDEVLKYTTGLTEYTDLMYLLQIFTFCESITASSFDFMSVWCNSSTYGTGVKIGRKEKKIALYETWHFNKLRTQNATMQIRYL